ncbi:MAG: hypothetical protein HY329_18675 [Chloroflexi bacterium]|nr:hypothetical protein [Chloroflexota bacterium]
MTALPASVADLSGVAVVATGAAPGHLEVATSGGARIVDTWTVLEGRAEVGKRVLVVDETGMRPGFSVAEYLATRGHAVELVTPAVYPGQGIEPHGWRMTYQRLLELGVRFRPLTAVAHVDGERVTVKHVFTNARDTIQGVEAVVAAMAPRASDALFHALQDQVEQLHLIGDAVAPRGIEEAVYEGQKVGREI